MQLFAVENRARAFRRLICLFTEDLRGILENRDAGVLPSLPRPGLIMCTKLHGSLNCAAELFTGNLYFAWQIPGRNNFSGRSER